MGKYEGFTLVEVVISITLVVSFVAMMATAYGYISSSQEDLRRLSIASSIAKSNLNKYKVSLGLECSSETETVTLLDDSSDNKQATPESGFVNLSQSVTAQYSRGCEELPIVTSTVTYGREDNEQEVSFATYAKL